MTSAPFKMEKPATKTVSGKTWWQVNTRDGDIIQHHKFNDEDAASEFVASRES